MFEKFLEQNADTFRQRYEGTYGFYRDVNHKRLLVNLQLIRHGICHFIDERGVAYQLNANTTEDIGFEFIPPRARYYNVDKSAVLVRRIAQRQFQRGITSKNTEISFIATKGLWTNHKVDFPILAKLYGTTESFADAYKDWDNRPAVAISEQLALNKITSKVYVFERHIGGFIKVGNHFSVKLEEPNLWRTEISDAFRTLGCSVEIT